LEGCLKEILEHVGKNGRVFAEGIVNYFRDFLGLVVEKKSIKGGAI